MGGLIGQKSLNFFLDSLDLRRFPNSTIVLGDEGCGKHLLVTLMAQKLSLPLVTIEESLSDEQLNAIYRSVTPTLYSIDASQLTEKKQSPLLKFLEEPPANAFVVVLTTSMYNLLQPLRHRSSIITFEPYSPAELQQFAAAHNITLTESQLQSNILKTPGDVLQLISDNIDVEKIQELSHKVCEAMAKASYPNALTIADKLNYKDEFDKINHRFFLRALYSDLNNKYLRVSHEEALYYEAREVARTIQLLKDNRINKKLAITAMVSKMWSIARSYAIN